RVFACRSQYFGAPLVIGLFRSSVFKMSERRMVRTGNQFATDIGCDVHRPFHFIQSSLTDGRIRADGIGIGTRSQNGGHLQTETFAMPAKSCIQFLVVASIKKFYPIVPDFL